MQLSGVFDHPVVKHPCAHLQHINQRSSTEDEREEVVPEKIDSDLNRWP